jgi:hypothetical protein
LLQHTTPHNHPLLPHLRILHPIPQRPNPIHINLNHIPRPQKLRSSHRIPHTRTRTRHNHRAPAQRRALRHILDEIRNLKAQIVNRRGLAHFPIDFSLQVQDARVRNDFGRDQGRPQGRIRVETFGKIPLRHGACEQGVALEFAARDVVAGAVPADVAVCVGGGHVFCVAGDDEAEFAFVVGLVVLGDFGDYDGCAMV